MLFDGLNCVTEQFRNIVGGGSPGQHFYRKGITEPVGICVCYTCASSQGHHPVIKPRPCQRFSCFRIEQHSIPCMPGRWKLFSSFFARTGALLCLPNRNSGTLPVSTHVFYVWLGEIHGRRNVVLIGVLAYVYEGCSIVPHSIGNVTGEGVLKIRQRISFPNSIVETNRIWGDAEFAEKTGYLRFCNRLSLRGQFAPRRRFDFDQFFDEISRRDTTYLQLVEDRLYWKGQGRRVRKSKNGTPRCANTDTSLTE
jgi:hypothetical protein